MKLSRTVAYAVQAVVQLAQSESSAPIPCSHLAAEGGMPERFLLQILRNLVTKGILRSTRGVDGGYTLVRPAQEISLLDMIEAIEGPLDPDDPIGNGVSISSQQKLREALQDITDQAKKQLAAVKLSSLIPPPKPKQEKESDKESMKEKGKEKAKSKAKSKE